MASNKTRPYCNPPHNQIEAQNTTVKTNPESIRQPIRHKHHQTSAPSMQRNFKQHNLCSFFPKERTRTKREYHFSFSMVSPAFDNDNNVVNLRFMIKRKTGYTRIVKKN